VKPARAAGIAGLVVALAALPVTAFALSATDDDPGSGTPAGVFGSPTSQAGQDDDPGTDDQGTDDQGTDDQGTDEKGSGGDNGAAGRAHADAMKAWAHCVAEAASGPKADGSPVPPKTACGDKPVGPGRAKHANGAAGGKSGDHKPTKTHGKSGSH
jgi:hypothetical protein